MKLEERIEELFPSTSKDTKNELRDALLKTLKSYGMPNSKSFTDYSVEIIKDSDQFIFNALIGALKLELSVFTIDSENELYYEHFNLSGVTIKEDLTEEFINSQFESFGNLSLLEPGDGYNFRTLNSAVVTYPKSDNSKQVVNLCSKECFHELLGFMAEGSSDTKYQLDHPTSSGVKLILTRSQNHITKFQLTGGSTKYSGSINFTPMVMSEESFRGMKSRVEVAKHYTDLINNNQI